MFAPNVDDEKRLETFVGTMMPYLNEKSRKLFLASLSNYLGYGSARILSEMTGITQQTITAGKKECKTCVLDPMARPDSDTEIRVRRPGAGRKSLLELNPEIEEKLYFLLDGNTVGDPMSALTWTVKSTTTLAAELKRQGYSISHDSVGNLLKIMGFSLQQNKKYTESGNPGPDRDAQFRFIKSESENFINANRPVISIDAKKKELVGDFKNNGAEYRPVNNPRKVNDHDFGTERATPYGIYDVGDDKGFVNVGISADTAQFAVNSIRSWWQQMGSKRYPGAKDVMITADCGGSNGRRNRLWKTELQKLADETGLTFHVRHYPPGTSKWNKIEHRMFSFISMNWKGKPLSSIEIIVNLIAATRNDSGLEIMCVRDDNNYNKGIKVTEEELEQVNLYRLPWHGEWNYSIAPNDKKL